MFAIHSFNASRVSLQALVPDYTVESIKPRFGFCQLCSQDTAFSSPDHSMLL